MNLTIKPLGEFKKEVKKLAKKYKQITKDLKSLNEVLISKPNAGIDLGANCYKIRLANSSIPTGKRAGFRVIYYYIDEEGIIYLMSIYAKSELENVDDKRIVEILKKYDLV